MRTVGTASTVISRMPAVRENRTGFALGTPAPKSQDSIVFSGKTCRANQLNALEKADLKRMLDTLERKSIGYFLDYRTPAGLIPDRVRPDATGRMAAGTIASVAATGFGLAILPLAVEKGMISRQEARKQAEETLKTIRKSITPKQRGWLAHFLDGETGKPLSHSEISSVDTALFMLGALAAGEYFGGRVKRQAEALFNNIDFGAMLTRDGNAPESRAFSLGFHLENGQRRYIPHNWDEYSEGILVPLLALASTAIPDAVWKTGWDRSRQWREGNTETFVRLPLFTYFYPHAFLNLKDREDAAGDDFWAASTAAVRMHGDFCRKNGYPADLFGLSACDGPEGYRIYWPSEAFHDGTIAPPALVACLPFDERAAYKGLKAMEREGLLNDSFGIACGWNVHTGWRPEDALGIDLGSMILMLDAAGNGLVHKLTGKSPLVQKALRRAGFSNKN